MGQSQSNDNHVEQYNTLVAALVNSNNKEEVTSTLSHYHLLNHSGSIIPDFLSDIIGIMSLLFMIGTIVYLHTTIRAIRKDMDEHKRRYSKTDKNVNFQ